LIKTEEPSGVTESSAKVGEEGRCSFSEGRKRWGNDLVVWGGGKRKGKGVEEER